MHPVYIYVLKEPDTGTVRYGGMSIRQRQATAGQRGQLRLIAND
jgi:hypothetical protein